MRRDDQLIADYLLGELSAEARADVESRMAREPEFADAVARMEPIVTGLGAVPDLGWAEVDSPPLPPLPPLPGLARPRRLAARRWAGVPTLAVAAAVAVLAAVVAIAVLAGRDSGEPASGPTLALARIDQGGTAARGDARVVGSGDAAALRVDVSGLAPSRTGAFYEVWLMASADRLVSLGSFRVPASGRAQVDVPLPVGVRDFPYIDVSLEREDGNPAHSGISVLRGPTTPA